MADLNMTTTAVTLSAGVGQHIVNRSEGNRQYLAIQNTGLNPVTISFTGIPAAGQGLSLDPASASGGQGGVWEWKDPHVPIGPVYAISAAGTVVVVVVG